MRLQARSDHIGIYDEPLVPSILPKIDTGIRFLRSRLLEIAVGGLLVIWWVKVFRLWTSSLQWAATLGLSQP